MSLLKNLSLLVINLNEIYLKICACVYLLLLLKISKLKIYHTKK